MLAFQFGGRRGAFDLRIRRIYVKKSGGETLERRRVIGFEIKSISNMIRRKLDDTFSEPEFDGLTGMQNAIMGYIMHHAEKGDVFQRDIEKEFCVRRSTATVMLKNLEQKGYILRIPVEYDARLKKIILTEKAEKLQQKVRKEIDAFHEQLEGCLTKEEREQLFALLEKIKLHLMCEKKEVTGDAKNTYGTDQRI